LDYLFISPIFDSISKIGYKSNLDFNELKECLTEIKNNNIIALGGVKMDNVLKLKNIGFESFALLGSIWNNGNPLVNTKSILDFITSQQFDI
jgi:thiamine-phosphate pyrophosphorylase